MARARQARRKRASFRVFVKGNPKSQGQEYGKRFFHGRLFPAGSRTGRKENMDKEEATVLANEGKKKAIAFWAAFKEKIVALWKSGRKGKAICIGGALVVLMLLMQCGGESDSSGRGGKYTGEYFWSVFVGEPEEDEGVIYNAEVAGDFFDRSQNNGRIQVMQATREGNLVRYEDGDRTVWVETPGKYYEDGQTLGGGFYIRRGLKRYTNAFGAERAVARYVEVTDKSVVKKLRQQVAEERAAKEKAEREREEAARQEKMEKEAKAKAQAKAEAEARAKAELAAEGQPFEVNAPVKSLCGFSIGATPSSVIPLFKKDSWSWDGDRRFMRGELATPFRHFDYAYLDFKPDPRFGGKHLARVKLSMKDQNFPQNWKTEEISEENKTIAAMLEKKFGIEFEMFERTRAVTCTWKSECGDGCIAQQICLGSQGQLLLEFDSAFVSAMEEKALKEAQRPKPVKLSSDVGADQL